MSKVLALGDSRVRQANSLCGVRGSKSVGFGAKKASLMYIIHYHTGFGLPVALPGTLATKAQTCQRMGCVE